MPDPVSIVYPATTAHTRFVAWGSLTDAMKNKGQRLHVILYQNSNQGLVHQGRRLHSNPPLWAALFRGITVEAKDYILEVWDRPQEDGGAMLTKSTTLEIKGKSTQKPKVGYGDGPWTTSPSNDTHVSSSYYAMGSSTDAYNVSGTMTLGNNVYHGTTQYQPTAGDNYFWAIQFNNLPNGTGYVLDVWNTNGEYAPEVTGLIVP